MAYGHLGPGVLQPIGNYGHLGPGVLQPIGNYGHLGPGVLQPIGLGDWCSSTHPQQGCQALVGICKPMDFATLEKYKTLQRELNRLLKLDNKSLLDVDGRIGPKTVSALSNYVGGYTHCDQVAGSIDSVISLVKGKVGMRAAPVVADPPRSKDVASKYDPTTKMVVHPPQGAGFLGMPWWLLLTAGVAGYLIYTTTGPAKKKRAAKKRKTTKRKTTRRKRRLPKTRTTITRY